MPDDHKEDFLQVVREFDNAMLITRDSQGTLQGRPMVIAKLEPDGDLWFASDRDSGKVEEILARPQVCVTMAGGGNFAAITGLAEVVTDRGIIESLWSETWRVWFPQGPADSRIALIRIHADTGEYWSNSGTNRIKYLFDAAKAYLQGERPSDIAGNQHAHVDL